MVNYLLCNGANADYVSALGLKVVEYAILPGFYSIAFDIYRKCRNREIKSAEELKEISSQFHYRYVNYDIFLDNLQKMIEPENVPDFLTKTKVYLNDPVIDPRETWKEWFKRNLEFKDPPLVERNELPLHLQPQNKKFGKVKYFFSKVAMSPLSQPPNYYPPQQNQLSEQEMAEKNNRGMTED
jgi:hypothetical protein